MNYLHINLHSHARTCVGECVIIGNKSEMNEIVCTLVKELAIRKLGVVASHGGPRGAIS